MVPAVPHLHHEPEVLTQGGLKLDRADRSGAVLGRRRVHVHAFLLGLQVLRGEVLGTPLVALLLVGAVVLLESGSRRCVLCGEEHAFGLEPGLDDADLLAAVLADDLEDVVLDHDIGRSGRLEGGGQTELGKRLVLTKGGQRVVGVLDRLARVERGLLSLVDVERVDLRCGCCGGYCLRSCPVTSADVDDGPAVLHEVDDARCLPALVACVTGHVRVHMSGQRAGVVVQELPHPGHGGALAHADRRLACGRELALADTGEELLGLV